MSRFKKGFVGLPKPCLDCGKPFKRKGRYCKICDKCKRKRYLNSQRNRIKNGKNN